MRFLNGTRDRGTEESVRNDEEREISKYGGDCMGMTIKDDKENNKAKKL